MVVEVVAQPHGDSITHGADDKLCRIAAGIRKKGEEEVAQSNGEQAVPEAVNGLVVGEGEGHPQR